MKRDTAPTAAVIVIGNEILSGKTDEANVQFLGRELSKIGIVLMEARAIRDDTDEIVRHVNECRRAHNYVFTTGGIGPTHDDITAEAIASAFGTQLELNAEAVRRIGGAGDDLTEPRLKMAMIPVGASLVDNSVSRAPGFRLENVFVFAGVPSIARAMFEAVKGDLVGGNEIQSASVDVFLRESEIARPLQEIANANPDVEIGSYPFSRDGTYGANLVVRGTNPERISDVLDEIVMTMQAAGARTGEPR